MTSRNGQVWPYPGSRWWKFDFHTHTPASLDSWWTKNGAELSPESWLRAYMAAGMDCVAVTDHNSGAWVDKLKGAYAEMKSEADAGSAPEGFRELTLFPGLELSVHGGFHLLAILDPTAGTGDIDTLLGHVDYDGTKGDSDGVTRKGAADVVGLVLKAGGLPIPAHADGGKGLLEVMPDDPLSTRQDANTVRQVLEEQGILAMEVLDRRRPKPTIYQQRRLAWSEVLGSDCHNFRGGHQPGSRYTWVKMAKPSLEGLRLALLDGNGVSIRRSDEGEFEPFKKPRHFITSIQIDTARFMGNETPEKVKLTPFYNALIGGRGTGKSTIVQALRLAYRRDEDIKGLRGDNELRRRFERFKHVVKGRDGDGALRAGTEVRVELIRDDLEHGLRWRQDGQGGAVEERGADGKWRASASEVISAERFPIRLLSQGQIAAMAGEDRQALLKIIDEAAGTEALHTVLDEAKRAYLSQRARLRELEGRLAGRPEIERKLAEVMRRLEAFSGSDNAGTLSAHQRAVRQQREIEGTLAQLRAVGQRIDALGQELLLDDWPEGVFDVAQDSDALEWRAEAERALEESRGLLARASETLAVGTRALASDVRLEHWRQRADQAKAEYEKLQAVLQAQGDADPEAFGRLVQERQQLEVRVGEVNRLGEERDRLSSDSETQWQKVSDARKALTRARSAFVRDTLHANAFVRMEVVPFGFDVRVVEHSLRGQLGVRDERFESDILRFENGEPTAGLALELVRASDRDAALTKVKQRLIDIDGSLGGHFRNYLEREMEKPEFGDHLRCWFPEDDLRIEYNRGEDNWAQITEGSQGQRSAALLAFLLAFGDEPLVLDQPEDDLDNHLIYGLIVQQIRENKLRRQLIIATHNPNVVVNGDAEMVHALDFRGGQCRVVESGALQESAVREEVCRVMEGGRVAFRRRWARLGRA